MTIEGPTITEVTHLPVDFPPPNDLRRGDVVVNRRDPDVRWIVQCDPGDVPSPAPYPFPTGRRTVTMSRPGMGEGIRHVTDNHDRSWVKVPYSDYTALERMQHAWMTWRPLTERTPEDIVESGPADDDQETWHLLMALLPQEQQERMQLSWDWPTTWELALEVGRYVDSLTATRPAG